MKAKVKEVFGAVVASIGLSAFVWVALSRLIEITQ